MRYILNINSKKIHKSNSIDGRCKLSLIKEEHKMYFDDLNLALKYPNEKKPMASKCSFCFKNL